jgi:3-oxoacyl-[acyl-carrier protein] reductase
MDLELAGRTALIIGGSHGIGASLAGVFAEEGCDVAVTYRHSRDGAEQVAALIRRHGRRAWLAPLDLGRPTAAARAAREIVAETDGLDIVVMCAGRNIVTPFDRITEGEWREITDVNLTGVFTCLQVLAPMLRPGGSIVTVASVAAHTGAPHHMHYAAAKAGLVNLTKSLARELAPHVRANCVAPGITLTPMGEDTIASLPADYAEQKLLLERFATSRRVAQTIAVVASPVSEYMTGTTIDVNSGRYLR